LGVLTVLLGVTATNVEVFVLRPLRALLRAAQELTQNRFSGAPVSAPAGALRELAAGMNRLRDRMQDYETRLAQEKTRHQALEQSVRELEDRYALTVERANDGIWEWNVESGAVEFSLRWRGLLGQMMRALLRSPIGRACFIPRSMRSSCGHRKPHEGSDAALRHGIQASSWRRALPLGTFARYRDSPCNGQALPSWS
jgi:PAS domain-containing protein